MADERCRPEIIDLLEELGLAVHHIELEVGVRQLQDRIPLFALNDRFLTTPRWCRDEMRREELLALAVSQMTQMNTG
ncbi:MAG: hypothetical protein HY710_02820 [Candidatus Latescibacteria bacterium]|nr:hypothetical protein [Candidatus Latescibacterota bacterium]